ncbi:MAG: hypothetical protein H0U53_11085 [Actinobacteria bacterium]|nr:hypothetical protein [Actinomycetota bacterium]
MPDYLIVNGNAAPTTSVNVAGKIVPKGSIGRATLTDVELAAVAIRPGLIVMATGSTRQQLRSAAKIAQYRKIVTL